MMYRVLTVSLLELEQRLVVQEVPVNTYNSITHMHTQLLVATLTSIPENAEIFRIVAIHYYYKK